MPYEVFLALRYLRSRHKRRLTRATTLAAVLGITVGVAALIVALALANGFRVEMRDKILMGTAHISVMRSDGLPLTDFNDIVSRLRQVNGVVDATATTYDAAMAIARGGSTYAVLRGVQKSGRITLPAGWMRDGTFDAIFEARSVGVNETPKAILGKELATRLKLKTGDTFQLIPANSSASSNARRVQVAGTFTSGLFEFDSTWIYLPLETVAAYAGADHAAAVVSVQVENIDEVKIVAEQIRGTLGTDYRTIDWQDANQPLFSALAIERRMGLIIIGLLIAIAVINIATMLILVVVERRRDIAILSTLGATRRSVMSLFLIEGAIVGAAGAACGVLIGLAACLIGNYYELVSLPADVYSISSVPLIARAGEVVFSALLAFLLSIVATIYPAFVASRMRPVETLRDAT